MAAGIGALGQGLGAGIQGYTEGRKTVLKDRMDQANVLYERAKNYSDQADKFGASGDEDMKNLMYKAYAESMDQADKLAGAKGQGAFKAIRGMVGLVIPAVREQTSSSAGAVLPSGQGAATQPSPVVPSGASAVSPQQSPSSGNAGVSSNPPAGPPPNAVPVSPTAGTPAGGSIWQQAAANPPMGAAKLKEVAAQRAGVFVDQYPTLESTKADPEYGHKWAMASVQAAKAGLNLFEMQKQRWEPVTPMMELNPGNPVYDHLAKDNPQMIAGSKVPLTTYADMLREVPGADKIFKDSYAKDQMAVANGTLTKESDPQRWTGYKQKQMMLEPRNPSEISVIEDSLPSDHTGADLVQALHSYDAVRFKMQQNAETAGNPARNETSQIVTMANGQYGTLYSNHVTHASEVVPSVTKKKNADGTETYVPVMSSRSGDAGTYLTTKYDPVTGRNISTPNTQRIFTNLQNGTLDPDVAQGLLVSDDILGPKMYTSFQNLTPPAENKTRKAIEGWIDAARKGTLGTAEYVAPPDNSPAPQGQNQTNPVAPMFDFRHPIDSIFGTGGASYRPSTAPPPPQPFTNGR